MPKEYEIKPKMEQEQWLQPKKCCFHWVITWPLLFSGADWPLVGEIKIWWGESTVGDFSRWGRGDEQIFGWWGGLSPSRQNPVNWCLTNPLGFPNSGKRWGEGGEDQKFYWGNLFTGWRKPEEGWFWQFEPFLKLKRAFCEYWTSIKIKISMT